MSKQNVHTGESGKIRDVDLAGAEVAIKRAARKARERANRFGFGVFVLKNGKIVEERGEIGPEIKS